MAVIAMSCGAPVHTHHEPDASADEGADASGDGAIAMMDAAVVAPDGLPACKPASILHGDGKHNPGQDCMGGCHEHFFSFSGTLYMADGVTPAVGATVTVVDHNGVSQDAVVGTNGNFYSYLPVAYPITVTSSLCPSVQVMTTQATAGGCNSSSCHGGSQGMAHL